MAIQGSRNGMTRGQEAVPVTDGQNLAKTCGDAAEYMAHARKALDTESADPNQALAHLDSAISCLKSLSSRSRTAAAETEGTVAAFRAAAERRSA